MAYLNRALAALILTGALLGPATQAAGKAAPRKDAVRTHPARRTPPARPGGVVVASWYYDYGSTASGYHAQYGVAVCGVDGFCFPFGTRIRVCYAGCVVATVDDHGPYVYGRGMDLDQNTARAIGMTGVALVRYTVLR
jgi:rare lipoprotein A (peptidoglycan hydrolase)